MREPDVRVAVSRPWRSSLNDEAALVERARHGDLEAYQVLVRMHQDAAVRLAATVSGGWGDPEAAAQEALVKAFGALSRFRPGAPFGPWLFRIVVNEARNARRSGQRRRQLVERLGHSMAPHSTTSPETALLDADERRLLVAAVQRLPHRQREAVACRYFLELSEAETAEVLGIALGTVKSRVSRALRKLRADLDATGSPQPSEEVS
jgi:RNA polymerase sigma-70 factor (ECF subfamily)